MFQFVDSRTKKDKGLSTVIIKYKRNLYSGQAKLHPEDDWSEFTGCRYAEMRARIKALKAEHKKKKASCEECRKFVNAICSYKNFDKNSPTAKAMFRQLNRRIKEVNKIAEEIGKMEMELNISIAQQNRLNERFNKKG